MKSGVWIEAWEAASVELIRRIRDEWVPDAQPDPDQEPEGALQGVGEVRAHGGSAQQSEETGRCAEGGAGDGEADESHSGLRTGLHAQDIPGDIGAQFFTSNRTASRALDQRALFRRNAAHVARPLPNQLGLATDCRGDGCLPPRSLIDVLSEVHAAYLKRGALFNQAQCLLLRLSIALGIDA